MEILNNICTALSMPNEGLVNALAFPILLVENFLAVLLFSSILNMNISRKQKSLYILFTSFEGFISLKYFNAPINTFINYIFTIVLIYKLFKLNWVKSIFAAILPSMFFRANWYVDF